MGIKKTMTGTPWHVEYLHSNPFDRSEYVECSELKVIHKGVSSPKEVSYGSKNEATSDLKNAARSGSTNDTRSDSKNDGRITPGSQYTLCCIGDHHLRTVTVRPESAGDRFASQDRISPDSSLARALAGRQVGDVVTVKGFSYKIEKIFNQSAEQRI